MHAGTSTFIHKKISCWKMNDVKIYTQENL